MAREPGACSRGSLAFEFLWRVFLHPPNFDSVLTENQSIYVPLGAVHRMENPGKVPMVLIEAQTGSYLGEDDIIRYEDVYARS